MKNQSPTNRHSSGVKESAWGGGWGPPDKWSTDKDEAVAETMARIRNKQSKSELGAVLHDTPMIRKKIRQKKARWKLDCEE